jgi:hypothetical protein
MNRLWKEIKQSSFCRSNETSYSVQSNVYIMKFLKTVVTITEYKKIAFEGTPHNTCAVLHSRDQSQNPRRKHR